MPPDTKLIAFDTSAAHCAAALLLGERIVTRVDEMTKGQAEHLLPMLEEMLAKARIGWSDLDGIGVGTGPGNFTGIRIAVSAARGLSLGLDKPAIGVNGFDARAYAATRPFTAIVPAPRNQAYVQFFEIDGKTSQPMIMDKDSLPVAISPATPDFLIGAIVQIAAARLDEDKSRPAPLYVRAADAAPPRDPAPTILP